MAGWHHRLNGQGGLACCDSWGTKSRTRLSDRNELYIDIHIYIELVTKLKYILCPHVFNIDYEQGT